MEFLAIFLIFLVGVASSAGFLYHGNYFTLVGRDARLQATSSSGVFMVTRVLECAKLCTTSDSACLLFSVERLDSGNMLPCMYM